MPALGYIGSLTLRSVCHELAATFDQKQHVGGARVVIAVVVGAWLQQQQVRLRLAAVADSQWILHADYAAIGGVLHEPAGESDDQSRVTAADRAHLDDVAVDELDAVILAQDTGLAQAMVPERSWISSIATEGKGTVSK